MGLFSKAKKADQPGTIGVKGMGPIHADPALLGGPSTKALSTDDPLLQPVNGVSLEMYGTLAKEAQARGIADEDGMAALAEELHGVPAADAKAAFKVWVERMGQSMVVGQQFRTHLGY